MSLVEKSQQLRNKLLGIKLVAMDVDGVLTDGKLTFDSEGVEYKSFHVLDGLGIKNLIEYGLEVALITGRESQIVARRAQELNINHVHQGVSQKGLVFKDLLNSLNLSSEVSLFVGDDEPDIPAMTLAGVAVAPSNAVESVKLVADILLERAGGEGAVRELSDLLLSYQRPANTQ